MLKGKTAQTEQIEAQIKVKVDHVFLKIKQQFGYTKARCRDRGLAKNTNRLHAR